MWNVLLITLKNQGKLIDGILVLSWEAFLEKKIDAMIIIASSYADEIEQQLKDTVTDYLKIYDANPLLQFLDYMNGYKGEKFCILTDKRQDKAIQWLINFKDIKAKYRIMHFEELLEQEPLLADDDHFFILDSVHHSAMEYILSFVKKYSNVVDCCKLQRYFDTDEIIDYTYGFTEKMTAEDWRNHMEVKRLPESVSSYVNAIKKYGKIPLFQLVEVETINKCNGICSFCPANQMNDMRETKLMSDALFSKIIQELADLNYRGRISLFSYNEPFLDSQIIERHAYVRKMLPNAKLHIMTNGILLTLEKFLKIIPYLDEMVIDNYNVKRNLIPSVTTIRNYCLDHPELKKKVTISMRRPDETLSSNGGDSPNNSGTEIFGNSTCALPFQQMVIRPDGKVSLCCLDTLEKYTLGDVSSSSLLDVWFGEAYQRVRDQLYRCRKSLMHCEKCDYFQIY